MTQEDKKRHTIAFTTTLVVHLVLLALLYIMSIKPPDKTQKDNDGIPVLLGDVTDAGGLDMNGLPQPSDGSDASQKAGTDNSDLPTADEDIMPQVKDKTEDHKPDPKDKTPKKEKEEHDRITQKDEQSIAAEKARKAEKLHAEQEAEARRKADAEAHRQAAAEAAARRKAEAEAAAEARRKAEEEAAAKRKAAEEAVAKKRAEEKARATAAAAAAANKMAGAFGKKNGQQGSSGYTNGKGSQGSPTGNSNTGALAGKGGIGTSAVVGDRTAVYLQKPTYDDLTAEGTIVIGIVVNSDGAVISAVISNSTTTSPALRAAAIKAAKKSRFSAGSDNAENGRITYRFKLN